jgi:hypothetical protein
MTSSDVIARGLSLPSPAALRAPAGTMADSRFAAAASDPRFRVRTCPLIRPHRVCALMWPGGRAACAQEATTGQSRSAICAHVHRQIVPVHTCVAPCPCPQCPPVSQRAVSAERVDKYGRTVASAGDDMRRFYRLDEDTEKRDAAPTKQKPSPSAPAVRTKRIVHPPQIDDDDDDDDDDDEEEDEEEDSDAEDRQIHLDRMRGEGLPSASDDSEDDGSADEDDSDEGDDPDAIQAGKVYDEVWAYSHGEQVPVMDDATKRLAIVNLDWDHVRAVDLFALLASFVPEGGVLRSVTVFPSDYGTRRMAIEDIKGPLLDSSDDESSGPGSNDGSRARPHIADVDDEVDEEGEPLSDADKRIRRYQLKRMRYYYAVAVFDSPVSATAVYEQCNGTELESSANVLDLRYIPDDTDFDQQPRDSASSLPAGFAPRAFVTKSLQQSRAALEWDQPDEERTRLLTKRFSRDALDKMDLQAYVASESSSSSESDEDLETSSAAPSSSTMAATNHAQCKRDKARARYASLLASLAPEAGSHPAAKKKDWKKGDSRGAAKAAGDDSDVDMEITFEPGLRGKAEDALKRKKQREQAATMSVWDKVLEKRKMKRKEHKEQAKARAQASGEDAGNTLAEGDWVQAFSDDEVAVDESDPFFSANKLSKTGKARKSKKSATGAAREAALDKDEDNTKQAASLELLMMDEEEHGAKHFGIDDVLAAEKRRSGKHKKRKGGKAEASDAAAAADARQDAARLAAVDSFKPNLQDPRFQALYTSHEFAIDRTDPRFKETGAMREILNERHRRRQETSSHPPEESSSIRSRTVVADAQPRAADLSALVSKIKRAAPQPVVAAPSALSLAKRLRK